MRQYILLFQCPDRKGIVARLSDLIFRLDGNIITADQHTTDAQNGDFFIRIEFALDCASYSRDSLELKLAPLAEEFSADFRLYDQSQRMRMGILVTCPDHCLFDLLYRWKSGELLVDIPFVISNCQKHREFVEQNKIPFYYIPAAKDDRREQELLACTTGSDFLVLSRYMLVLSGDFLKNYGRDIINIHHGFLPSFKGSNPHRQALSKGVKVIGATAHFVSEALDDGPIISQAVESVSHEDDYNSFLCKGKNLEKRALSAAVAAYLEHRIIKYRNKTIVF